MVRIVKYIICRFLCFFVIEKFDIEFWGGLGFGFVICEGCSWILECLIIGRVWIVVFFEGSEGCWSKLSKFGFVVNNVFDLG